MTPDVAERLAALDGEARPGADGGARLYAALGDDSELVRERAIALAARWWTPERLSALVADEHDVARRNSALCALERQGPYAVPHLEAMTRAADPDVVMFAAQVLALVAEPASTATLLGLLEHPEPNVAQAAAEALGNLRARAAVPALLGLLERDLWLQLAAVVALGAIGDTRAAPALLRAADDPLLAAPALEALSRVAAPATLPRLVARLVGDDHEPTRRLALQALAAVLERRALPLGQRRRLRASARDGSLAELLAGALADDQVERARAAALVVIAARLELLLDAVVLRAGEPAELEWLRGVVQRQRAAAALVPLCSAEDPRLREGALRLGADRLLDGEALVMMLYDGHAGVRAAACEALAARPELDAGARLVTRLRCGELAEETAAATAFRRLPERHRLILRPLLTGATVARRDRLAALAALTGTRGDVLTRDLLELAADADAEVRRAAIDALVFRTGGAVARRLLAALADPVAEVRVTAIGAVARRGLRSAVPALVERISERGAEDRWAAAHALGVLAAAPAVPGLCDAFADAPAFERLVILGTLAKIGGREATAFLRQRLGDGTLEVRRAAARGLAEICRDPAHVDADTLATFARLAADEDWHVRHAAATGMGRAGAGATPAGRGLLLDLARDVDRVVAQAARAALAAPAREPRGRR